jgi:hypothetical protein
MEEGYGHIIIRMARVQLLFLHSLLTTKAKNKNAVPKVKKKECGNTHYYLSRESKVTCSRGVSLKVA